MPFDKRNSNFEIAALFHHLYGKAEKCGNFKIGIILDRTASFFYCFSSSYSFSTALLLKEKPVTPSIVTFRKHSIDSITFFSQMSKVIDDVMLLWLPLMNAIINQVHE